MNIREVSPNDPVSQVALNALMEGAPILQDAEFYTRDGSADTLKQRRTGNASTLFRSINENNVAVPPNPVYLPLAKKIASYDSKVDVVLEDRNEDPETELATQTRLDGIEHGYMLQEAFFTADEGTNAEAFNGFSALVKPAQVVTPTSAQVLQLGGDAVKQSQQEFVEGFLNFAEKIPAGGGQVFAYMNGLMRTRMTAVAKALGYYSDELDDMSRRIERIGDVVIRSAGHQSDGTMLLPFDKTLGANTKTSSIFFVRWGERTGMTCLTSVGVKGRYAGQVGNFLINNVNLDIAIAEATPKSLWEWRGVALEG